MVRILFGTLLVWAGFSANAVDLEVQLNGNIVDLKNLCEYQEAEAIAELYDMARTNLGLGLNLEISKNDFGFFDEVRQNPRVTRLEYRFRPAPNSEEVCVGAALLLKGIRPDGPFDENTYTLSLNTEFVCTSKSNIRDLSVPDEEKWNSLRVVTNARPELCVQLDRLDKLIN